ncbi:MAG: serine hydrolase, partial [Bacteroidota bacterium]
MKRVFSLVFLFSSIVVLAQKNPPDKKVQDFEAYILKAQKEWEVPGMAVAVVKDGKVLLAKGFGVKELGT